MRFAAWQESWETPAGRRRCSTRWLHRWSIAGRTTAASGRIPRRRSGSPFAGCRSSICRLRDISRCTRPTGASRSSTMTKSITIGRFGPSSTRGAPVAWRGHSDTETLIEAIAEWGLKGGLERAVGMFALAAWDHRDRTLQLARDRLARSHSIMAGYAATSYLRPNSRRSEAPAVRQWHRPEGTAVARRAHLHPGALLNLVTAVQARPRLHPDGHARRRAPPDADAAVRSRADAVAQAYKNTRGAFDIFRAGAGSIELEAMGCSQSSIRYAFRDA